VEPVLPGRGKRGWTALTAALVLAALLFLALGVWQVERRAEKLALIAAVDARVAAPPAAVPGPAQWPRIAAATDAYRHVLVRGVFEHDRETAVQAVTDFGPGYWIVTPLRTDDGWTVLVNRGFVPPDRRARAARRAGEPAGPVTITGLLRMSEPRGAFLRRNDPGAGRWYSRDVAAIGAARRPARLAPYFIGAAPPPRPARAPPRRPPPGLASTTTTWNMR